MASLPINANSLEYDEKIKFTDFKIKEKMLDALASQNLPSFKYYLNKMNLSPGLEKNKFLHSLMMTATVLGFLNIFDYIYGKLMKIRSKKIPDWNPLRCALAQDRPNKALQRKVQTSAEIQINRCSISKYKILHQAAVFGRIHIVRYLVERGFDVNSLDVNLNTPLLLAARTKHMDVARYLVKNGAFIHRKDINGKTSIDYLDDVDKSDLMDLCRKYPKCNWT